MKTKLITFCLLSFWLLSCGDEESETPSLTAGAPVWIGDYPAVAVGATSADLTLQTDRNAKVYYILADKPLNLSAAELIKQALAPNNGAIKSHGVLDVVAQQETKKTLSNLVQNTKYYSYVIAQNVGDTLFQEAVGTKQFQTYSRQDTLEFQSSAENRKVKYLLYRPEEVLKYPGKKYPIAYFLGGNGEVATSEKPVNMIRNGSLPEYIHKGNNVPMIVISVQHTVTNWNVELIDEAIEHGNTTYPVDVKKVYLIGISGGGFGCWNYAVTHPEKLAAIVPISGGGNTSNACSLKDMAVWAFHNNIDNTVASSHTKNMVTALKNCSPSKEVKQLIFPDTGHDCWRRVFDQNHANWNKSPGVEKFDIYAWLLSKSR